MAPRKPKPEPAVASEAAPEQPVITFITNPITVANTTPRT